MAKNDATAISSASACLAKGLVLTDQILAKQALLDKNLENDRSFKETIAIIEAKNIVDIAGLKDSSGKLLFSNDQSRAAECLVRLNANKVTLKCYSEIDKCTKLTAQLRREIEHLRSQYSLYKAMLNSRDFKND